MPNIVVNGTKYYYEESGSGDETIVFAHSLLFNLRMFDNQVEFLKQQCRCITFDFRGQGKSQISQNRYDLESLTEDTVEIIKTLHCGPCHFVGFSMGGMVALRLGIYYPDLLKSLILIDTSSEAESFIKKIKYTLLAFIARTFGLSLVSKQVMPIMFSDSFLQDPKKKEIQRSWENHFLENDKVGLFKAVMGVVKRKSVTHLLKKIDLPVLIIVGEHDIATSPINSKKLNEHIKHSILKIIPRSGHMTPVEEPKIVNEYLWEFLSF